MSLDSFAHTPVHTKHYFHQIYTKDGVVAKLVSTQ